MMKRLLILCGAAGLCVVCAASQGADKEKVKVDVSKIPPAADKKDVTYAGEIKPIFEQSCVKCHGAQRPKAHLRMDSLEGVLKGGEDGKVVVPGKSAESLLVHNVAHVGDPDQYMPPPKNKAGIGPLTKDQIGLIRAWIDQGAK
jgi:mono/diheme cytochrome c family protein